MYFKNIFDIETQKLCRSRKASFSSTIYDLDPDYWIIEEHDDGNLLLIIPLFHCNKLFSSNPDDIVIEKNKAIICRNNINTIIKAKSVLETVVKIDVNTSVLGVGETVIIDVDVSDENGFPLKDIEVELFESGQKVDNIKSVYTNSSGKCSFEYPFNYDGPFKFHVKVKDTKDYVGMVSNVVFVDTHVKDTMCLLESEYSSVNVGQPFRLLGKLLDLRGNPAGNMKLKLLKDNVLIEESFTDDKGRVSFDLLSDVGGVFTYQLVFDGVEKYRASSSRVVNVSVMKELTTIEVANGSIFVGDSYIIPYSVYDNNNNRPINVGNVELYFDDELLSTVVAGEELTVSPIVTSSYRLVYIGNGNYESSEANFTVEVNKLSTVTSLSSNVDSVVAGGEVVLTAFVKDSSGNPVSNIEVQLYRDGVSLGEEYKSITNSNGKTTFSIIVNNDCNFKVVTIENNRYKNSKSSTVNVTVETASNILFRDDFSEDKGNYIGTYSLHNIDNKNCAFFKDFCEIKDIPIVRNVRVTFNIRKPNSGWGNAFYIRFEQSPGNQYRIGFNSGSSIALTEIRDGTQTHLFGETSDFVKNNEWTQVVIEINNGVLKIAANGKEAVGESNTFTEFNKILLECNGRNTNTVIADLLIERL